VCEVDEDACVSCGACITACTYGAIEFYETPRGRKAKVNPVLCKGDGVCNTKCATGAIYLKHYTDEAIIDQIDAAFPEKFQISDSRFQRKAGPSNLESEI
jgi:heterodisulfide reductase subunit A